MDEEVVRQWRKCGQAKIIKVDGWTEKAIECRRKTPQDRGRQPKQGTAREQVEAKGASNRDKGQAELKARGRLKGTI